MPADPKAIAEEALRLAEGATPGEWHAVSPRSQEYAQKPVAHTGEVWSNDIFLRRTSVRSDVDRLDEEADADFLCAAANARPALAALAAWSAKVSANGPTSDERAALAAAKDAVVEAAIKDCESHPGDERLCNEDDVCLCDLCAAIDRLRDAEARARDPRLRGGA